MWGNIQRFQGLEHIWGIIIQPTKKSYSTGLIHTEVAETDYDSKDNLAFNGDLSFTLKDWGSQGDS